MYFNYFTLSLRGIIVYILSVLLKCKVIFTLDILEKEPLYVTTRYNFRSIEPRNETFEQILFNVDRSFEVKIILYSQFYEMSVIFYTRICCPSNKNKVLEEKLHFLPKLPL